MRSGVFQRAAVAMVMIVALLAPFGSCVQWTHKAAHSCCAKLSEPSKGLHADCCSASAPQPAVVVTPDLPDPSAIAVEQRFVSSSELTAPGELTFTAVIPPKSPPTGAFILRI